MTIDTEQIKIGHGVKNRAGNCRYCRQRWPCYSFKMAQEIERLTAERDMADRQVGEAQALYKDLQGKSEAWLAQAQARANRAIAEHDEVQADRERFRAEVAVLQTALFKLGHDDEHIGTKALARYHESVSRIGEYGPPTDVLLKAAPL